MGKKSRKNMRGFMCQSTATANAVCKVGDPSGSVIVPRRPDRVFVGDTRKTINAQYSRLNVDSHRSAPTSNKSLPFLSRKPEDNMDPKHQPKERQTCSQLASADQVFQVVVMRVSLHCQGCAGKLKKHLSKMEGVTSFNIDLETKRVTVMGHVSPVGVLESISKVKRAEFWPS